MWLLLLACTDPAPVTDSVPDADADTDADSDTDSDADSDADSDTDADSDADTDADTDTDVLCDTVPRQSFDPSDDGASGGAIFRFRTYTGSTPGWVSDVADRSLDDDDVTTTYRGPEVDGTLPFRDRPVTTFDGAYWRAEDAIDANDVTVEAWFRTSTSSGWQTLFSNTEGGGFSLKIKDGQLRGLYRLKDGSSWSDLEHIAFDVADDTWHHAAWVVDQRGDGYQMCLWLDGVSDCAVSADTDDPKDSSVGPTVGAEPNEDGGSYTYESHFAGEIYAVVVHDHALDPGWLADRVLRDGSRYFDSPSYHDYLSGRDGVDQRMADSIEPHPNLLEATAARYRLPFQDDRFVVQGVTGTLGGEVLLAMYYGAKDLHEDCDSEPYDVHSILVGVDPCASELTRVFLLREPDGSANTSHVGGAAMVGSGRVWTTGGDGMVLYDLEDGLPIEVEDLAPADVLLSGAPMWLDPIHTEVAQCGASFMTWDPATDRLWAGTFSTTSGANVCSFQLNADRTLGERVEHYTLPVAKVQGVQPLADGTVLLSTSYGDRDSALYAWTPGEDDATEVLSGPAGFEDLWLSPEGLVWTASESGGRYYQKRSDDNSECSTQWGDFYPYVFAVDPDVFLP